MSDIDTTNYSGVSVGDDSIVLLLPPFVGQRLSRERALNLAAWLVALADEGEFEALLEAVQAS